MTAKIMSLVFSGAETEPALPQLVTTVVGVRRSLPGVEPLVHPEMYLAEEVRREDRPDDKEEESEKEVADAPGGHP
jgi:hypothetical protein